MNPAGYYGGPPPMFDYEWRGPSHRPHPSSHQGGAYGYPISSPSSYPPPPLNYQAYQGPNDHYGAPPGAPLPPHYSQQESTPSYPVSHPHSNDTSIAMEVTMQQSRKRKFEEEGEGVALLAAAVTSRNPGEERKLKNRLNAKKSRERRKTHQEALEIIARELQEENNRFRQFVRQHAGCDPDTILQGGVVDEKKDTSATPNNILLNIPTEGIEALLRSKTPHKVESISKSIVDSGGSGSSCSTSSSVTDAYGNSHASSFLNTLCRGVGNAPFISPMDVVFLQALEDSSQCYTLSNPRMADNPIVYCSESCCTLTGYCKNEIVGRNVRLLYGPDTDNSVLGRMREKVSHGEPQSVCVLNYKKDGTPFWNRTSVSPLKDAKGCIIMTVEVFHEIADPSLLDETL